MHPTLEIIELRRFSEIPFRSVSFSGGSALPNRCHENVLRWIDEHPDDKAGLGWILVTIFQGMAIIAKHSVVRSGGEIFDITPGLDLPRRFMPYMGDRETFEQLPTILWGPAA